MRRKFWFLLIVVMGLHMANKYKDANTPAESDLPDGVVRRLPDGRVLMTDGSIQRPAEGSGGEGHTLHRVKEKGEKELVLDRAWRGFKDSV